MEGLFVFRAHRYFSSDKRVVLTITLVAFLTMSRILVNALMLRIFLPRRWRCCPLARFTGVLFVVAGLREIGIGALEQRILIAMAQLPGHVFVALLRGRILLNRAFVAKLIF